MHVIDTIDERLGDNLRAELHRGSKVRIAASAFSMSAFEALRDELEQIDELRFLFTEPFFLEMSPDDRQPSRRHAGTSAGRSTSRLNPTQHS